MSQKEVEKNSLKNTTLDDIRLSPDEEPIFVLRKKWYITDWGMKIMSILFIKIANISLVKLNDIEVVDCFFLLIGVLGLTNSLLRDLLREIKLYENGIYVRGLNFNWCIMYNDMLGFVTNNTVPAFLHGLRLYKFIAIKLKYSSYKKRFVLWLLFSSFKKDDLKKYREILESKGIKEIPYSQY